MYGSARKRLMHKLTKKRLMHKSTHRKGNP